MIRVLSESTPIAAKDHECVACEFILANGIDGNGFTRPELRALSKAKSNKWKIVKGQKYIKQNNVGDDGFYTFKAIPELHEICLKYDMYEF